MKIIPGDGVQLQPDIRVTLGPGMHKNPRTQDIVPATAGLLHSKVNKKQTNQLVYIESKARRYIPKANDFVVGVITGTIGESYKVSLQENSETVLLSMMAFPNASKKNRPNLKIGQVVYARVSQDIPEIDIELECFDATTGKEGGFGLLDESGFIFDVSLNFANELLFNTLSIYLEKLSTKCKFEIAIGLNGKIWLKCGDGLVYDEENKEARNITEASLNDLKYALAASKFLTKCETIPQSQIEKALNDSFKGL